MNGSEETQLTQVTDVTIIKWRI